MSQPRIDMRVIKRGITALHTRFCTDEDKEALDELADELDDRDDGASILIALTKQEADVALAALRAFQREYEQNRMRLSVSRITALDATIEEINAAIRGVVVPS